MKQSCKVLNSNILLIYHSINHAISDFFRSNWNEISSLPFQKDLFTAIGLLNPETIFVDISEDSTEAFQLCHEILKLHKETEIIIIVPPEKLEELDQWFQIGVSDFITLPLYASVVESKLKMPGRKPEHPTGTLHHQNLSQLLSEVKFPGFSGKITEELTTELYDSISEGICVLDTELTIQYANHQMKKWFSEILPLEGKKYHQHYQLLKQNCPDCPASKCLESGEFEFGEVVASNGMKFNLLCYPIFNEDNSLVIGVVQVFHEPAAALTATPDFAAIFRNAPDGVILFDAKNASVAYANEQACIIFEYSNTEIQSLSFDQFYHRNGNIVFRNYINGSIGRKDQNLCQKSSGRTFHAEISYSKITVQGSEYLKCVYFDITDAELSEDKLLLQNSLMNSVLNNNNGLLIFALDRQYQFTFFNNAFFNEVLEITGKKIEVGENAISLIPNKLIWAEIKSSLDKALNGQFQTSIRYQTQNKKYYEVNFAPFFSSQNQIIGLYVFIRDVTEHKYIDEQLRISENRLQSLFYNMPTGFAEHMVIRDEHGTVVDYKYTKVNPAFTAFTGLTNEVIGKSIKEIMPNIDQVWIERYGNVTNTGKAISFDEYSTPLQKYFRVYAFRSHEEHFATIFDDITLSKKAEQEISKRERNFRSLFEQSNDAILLCDLDCTKIVEANHRSISFFGFNSKMQLLRKPLTNFLPTFQSNGVSTKEILEKLTKLASSKNAQNMELIWQRNDGQTMECEVSLGVIDLEDSQLIQIIIIDITEKNKKQKELKKLSRILQTTQHISKVGYFELTLENKKFIPKWSKEVYAVLEKNPDDEISLADALQTIQYQDKKKIFRTVCRLIKEKEISRNEVYFNITPANGTEKHIRLIIQFNPDGNELSKVLFCIFQDITEIYKTRTALKLSENQIELLTMTRLIALWDYYPQTQQLKTNDNYEIMLGYVPGTFDNTFDKWLKLIHPDDLEKAKKDIEKHINGETPMYENEHRLLKKDGTYKWVRARGKVLSRDIHGKAQRFIGINIDIDANKRHLERMKIAKEAADAANTAKSSFLANMSHEIRTPMNSIIGFTDILDKRIEDVVLRDYLKSIKASGNALLELINDILDLSKIESGKVTLNPQSVVIKEFCQELEYLFQIRAEENNLQFEVILQKQTPCCLIFDQLRLRQIAINLIGNALKFTKRGFIQVVISSKNITPEKADLIIQVKDSGIGISENKLDVIFQDFTQSDDSITSNYGGTGLGLSISKRLVELLHGTIKVKSQVGKGSTFTVTIPGIPLGECNSIDTPLKIHGEHIQFEPARILVVDDIESNRKVLKTILELYNQNVILAEDGLSAYHKAVKHQPDLIFMDIRMPRVDGVEAALLLKENEQTRDIPIIACTARAFKYNRETIMESGFSGYLRKPIIEKELTSELVQYIPYKKIEKSPVVITNNGELKSEVIQEIIKIASAKWEQIQTRRSTKLQLEFVNILMKIAKKLKDEQLQNIALRLKHSLETYNIPAVNKIMDDFRILFEKNSE